MSMFMLLSSSWHCRCKSSPGSRDECSTQRRAAAEHWTKPISLSHGSAYAYRQLQSLVPGIYLFIYYTVYTHVKSLINILIHQTTGYDVTYTPFTGRSWLDELALRALDERSTSSFVNVCNITPFKWPDSQLIKAALRAHDERSLCDRWALVEPARRASFIV